MKHAGKAAIVTGAGRNIGEETARLLAREGANVAVADLDRERAAAVAAEIRASGGTAEAFVADVSSEEACEKLASEVAERFGRVDILVNNVAISDNKGIMDLTLEEWNRVLAITLTSPFIMGRAAARQMIKSGRGGVIVNLGSTSGYYGRNRALGYTAAKGGVVNLTKSMAIQLAPHNIRCVLAVPNKIGSPVGKAEFDATRPVTNLRGNRPGLPLDMAKVISFLASDDADFINGSAVFVDGGVTAMMPGGSGR